MNYIPKPKYSYQTAPNPAIPQQINLQARNGVRVWLCLSEAMKIADDTDRPVTLQHNSLSYTITPNFIISTTDLDARHHTTEQQLLQQVLDYLVSDDGPLLRSWENGDIGMFENTEWDWETTRRLILESAVDVRGYPSQPEPALELARAIIRVTKE